MMKFALILSLFVTISSYAQTTHQTVETAVQTLVSDSATSIVLALEIAKTSENLQRFQTLISKKLSDVDFMKIPDDELSDRIESVCRDEGSDINATYDQEKNCSLQIRKNVATFLKAQK